MSSPGSGWARVLRGSTLSVLTLALSLAAHVAAGGAATISPMMVFFGLILSGMCIAAADARRGFLGILAVMGLSQVVLHLLAGLSAHHDHAMAIAQPGPVMVTYHAVGALSLSALLARGERLMWALCVLLRLPLVAALLRVTAVESGVRAVVVHHVPHDDHQAFPHGAAAWRGPPVLVN